MITEVKIFNKTPQFRKRTIDHEKVGMPSESKVWLKAENQSMQFITFTEKKVTLINADIVLTNYTTHSQ